MEDIKIIDDLDTFTTNDLCQLVKNLESQIHAIEVQRCHLAVMKREALKRIYAGDPVHAPRFRVYESEEI